MGCGANNIFAVNFTSPSVVNFNGKIYADMNTPFLMVANIWYCGKLIKYMDEVNHFYVITPNTAKQI